jgi:3-mercaptopyruvate sulfurtransferase SseA
VWDVRDAAAYQRGHVAGAVNVSDALRVLRNPTTEDFIETARIEAILGGGGINTAREKVWHRARVPRNRYTITVSWGYPFHFFLKIQ